MDSEDSSEHWTPMGIGSKCVYCDHSPDDAASAIKDPIHYHPSCIMYAVIVLHYVLSKMIQKHFAEK